MKSGGHSNSFGGALLQSAAIREETAESPGQDQQTEGQLHSSGCQEAELLPVLVPHPPPHTP